MSRSSRVVVAAIAGLALLAAGLSIASARLGPTVDALRTMQSLDGTSVNSTIVLSFTAPMDHRSVERGFRIVPAVRGSFTWAGNQLVLVPGAPLRYSATYRVTVTGARDTSGKGLFHTYSRSFDTQSRHLLYIPSSGSDRGRLVLRGLSGANETVGDPGGQVDAFQPSFDRTLAVYTKRGGTSERVDEIWLLSLQDGSAQRVFRNAMWNITDAHLSPDGKTVGFLATNVRICRKYYGCIRNRTSPIIELLDLRSGKVRPFRSKSDVPITHFLDFAPSGQIAFTDLGTGLTLSDLAGVHIVHVPDKANSPDYRGFSPTGDRAVFVGQTPSSSGGDILVYHNGNYTDVSRGVYDSISPSFSNSGKKIAYAGYRGEKGIEPIYGITTYNLATGATRKLTSEKRASDFGPQWSTDDGYIAFVRSAPQEEMYMGTGELWVMKSDGRDARSLGVMTGEYQWVV